MATNYSGYWGSSSKSSRSSGGKRPAPGYQSVWNQCSWKINSYKQLSSQMTGPAKHGRPSPATLNTFSKWIEKGGIVHKVSAAQVKRWAKASQPYKSAASAKTAMQKKFGKGCIKAVTCAKSGGFLVVTPYMWKGKSFKFPQ